MILTTALALSMASHQIGAPRDMADAFLKQRVQMMASIPTPPDLDTLQKAQHDRKRKLYGMLGLDPMPARTPLHAHITGVLHRNGYRIEKVAFESRPRFFVTCHVYVPEPGGAMVKTKWPVIVNVNGHWMHKKDEDRVQLRCCFEALRGFVAIAVDSPGFSFEGNNLIERRAEGDHNDWALVEGGTCATGYYVWDTMRALDYIATRPDTDMSRVGLTGASGGGLATLYTFAADDRYKAAVPVVYMSSLELAPDNGCLCNHVPGTCQIGDRSDVIAIQAPKPVLIMGAQRDGEFPPDAMRLTHDKMARSWALYDKAADTYVKIFPGGHDYNKGMRESMIGFFEHYLLGKGDGSPVPEPPIQVIDSNDRSLLALDPPASNERTMRDLAKESLVGLRSVSAARAIEVNGGVPPRSDKGSKVAHLGASTLVTFESEPGLTTVVTDVRGGSSNNHIDVWLDDGGRESALKAAPVQTESPRQLFPELLGTGELAGVELRYLWYAGRSAPYVGGWQIVRMLELLHLDGSTVTIHARGPITSQAAMWAALINPKIASVDARDCLTDWAQVFDPGVSEYAVQPRANLCGPLGHLQSLVRNGKWESGRE